MLTMSKKKNLTGLESVAGKASLGSLLRNKSELRNISSKAACALPAHCMVLFSFYGQYNEMLQQKKILYTI